LTDLLAISKSLLIGPLQYLNWKRDVVSFQRDDWWRHFITRAFLDCRGAFLMMCTPREVSRESRAVRCIAMLPLL